MGFYKKELVLVQRLSLKFVWSKDWNKLHVCERIKRSVLKAEYEKGGLKAPDIECLDQCFSTVLPRNPWVPWASIKGSTAVVNSSTQFKKIDYFMFSKFLIDFNWQDGNNLPFYRVKSCQTMSAQSLGQLFDPRGSPNKI